MKRECEHIIYLTPGWHRVNIKDWERSLFVAKLKLIMDGKECDCTTSIDVPQDQVIMP